MRTRDPKNHGPIDPEQLEFIIAQHKIFRDLIKHEDNLMSARASRVGAAGVATIAAIVGLETGVVVDYFLIFFGVTLTLHSAVGVFFAERTILKLITEWRALYANQVVREPIGFSPPGKLKWYGSLSSSLIVLVLLLVVWVGLFFGTLSCSHPGLVGTIIPKDVSRLVCNDNTVPKLNGVRGSVNPTIDLVESEDGREESIDGVDP